MKADGFKWWKKRLGAAKHMYDIIRIDHFRAFADYYCIPFGSETAKTGEWKTGPGMDLFSKVFEELKDYPIIAEDLGDLSQAVLDLLEESGLALEKKENPITTRKSMHAFRDATREEKNLMIKQNPAYGRIVCRCEGVTEGEILDAIRINPKATDLDGVKRRTRAQMGRCQGGFCSPYIIELLSKELDLPYEKITKFGGESYVATGKTTEIK